MAERIKVTPQNATKLTDFKYCIDASDLKFPTNPGMWPMGIQTSLGNGSVFTLGTVGELGADYVQMGTDIVLTVIND